MARPLPIRFIFSLAVAGIDGRRNLELESLSQDLKVSLRFHFTDVRLEFVAKAKRNGATTLSNQIEGYVASISANGDLITNITLDQVANVPRDDSVSVKFGGHETLGIFPADHQQPPATMVASVDLDGFLKIEIVGISLSDMLGIKTDTAVVIVW